MSELVSFADASTFSKVNDRVYRGRITEDWLQGPGAFGGLLLAVALRAMQTEVEAAARLVNPGDIGGLARPPRVAEIMFVAPCRPGPVDLELTWVRSGSRVSTLRGDFRAGAAGGEAEIVCTVTVAFGAARPSKLAFLDEEPPAVAPWREVEPVRAEVLPVFTQHLDFRFAQGAVPYSAASEASLTGWVNLKERERTPIDAPLVGALLDAFPPVAVGKLDEPGGAATLGLQVSFAADVSRLALPADGPLLVDLKSRFAADGYAEDMTSLWTEDGQFLGRGHQVVAAFV